MKQGAVTCLVLCAMAAGWTCGARADRILLSPQGDTLPPNGFKSEFALSPSNTDYNLSWIQVSNSQGIEFEGQRIGLGGDAKTRYDMNVQYPLLTDLGTYPSVSVGVRDLLGTGLEHKAVYLAATKSFPLSDRQLHVLRAFKLNAGIGTGRMDGLFVGMEARLRAGVSLYAEFYRRRPNLGLALPLGQHAQVNAYSLDGTLFYGLSYSIAR
ncbi:MAG TPA: YjbH domain-containing protein [Chthonomonadaceae bacterium]|nr:YjbH domain-containing protein [Chthonomonadaceae bacterium]